MPQSEQGDASTIPSNPSSGTFSSDESQPSTESTSSSQTDKQGLTVETPPPSIKHESNKEVPMSILKYVAQIGITTQERVEYGIS